MGPTSGISANGSGGGNTAAALVGCVGGSLAVAAALYAFRRKISAKWMAAISDDVRVTGQTIVITGGNVGLGLATVQDLVKRGAGRIIICCRNTVSGTAVAASIMEQQLRQQNGRGYNTNPNVVVIECIHLDLSSLESVKTCTDELLRETANCGGIDAVILNAGVWIPMNQQCKTSDGFEAHFGINHLAHFYFLQCLLLSNKMEQQHHCRVVFVSSSLLKQGRIDMKNQQEFIYNGRRNDDDDDKQKSDFAPPTGYCDSKLMNSLTCQEFARRLQQQHQYKNLNITTCSVTPGFCKSSLGRNVPVPFIARIIVGSIIMPLFQRTSEQGARNIVFGVTVPSTDIVNGAMYEDGTVMTDPMLTTSTVSDTHEQDQQSTMVNTTNSEFTALNDTFVAKYDPIKTGKELWDLSEALLLQHQNVSSTTTTTTTVENIVEEEEAISISSTSNENQNKNLLHI